MPQPTVLIVDDDRSFVDALSVFLDENGYRAIPAYSGQDGRERLRAGEADLAIIDVHMPDVEGTELLAMARGLAKPIPVIMISSDDSEENARRCEIAGAARFMAKPLAPDDLLDSIPQTISGAA